jgi:hypothetical protein
MDEKGIFFTFMAFLMASAVLALSVSISQTEVRQQRNTISEAAFEETNNQFNNIRQQIIVAKEGTASKSYGRFTPFKRFNAGMDWFEIDQILPLDEKQFENAYNALNLFAIFSEQKGSQGTEVKIQGTLKDTTWSGTEEYPTIEYRVEPQCLLFYVEKDADPEPRIDDGAFFRKGTVLGDGCREDFSLDMIESYEVEIRIPELRKTLTTTGDFDDGGTTGPEAKVTVVWENCEPDCDSLGFSGGIWETEARLGSASSIGIELKAQVEINLEYDPDEDEFFSMAISKNPAESVEDTFFRVKTTFAENVDEVVLMPDAFRFSVEKPAFEVCRATEETGCAN